MEKEYQKIGNVFKFDEKFRTIVGLNEPYETLKNIIWQGTEKIDGTNIRIHWDGHDIEIAGHTDKAQIPPKLDKYLNDLFMTPEMEYVFEQIFGESEAYIFGEGFGAGIQKSGGDYGDVGFIVFDVNIDGFDLNRVNTTDVANKLGLPSVPVCFEGTLDEAKSYVAEHHMSTLNGGKHEMEGLVLVPRDIQLYDKKHHLIKCKCKYRDMVRAGLISV
jgi:ATP-dependent RNA circularization protein (DNA/RNA ligase family)